MNVAVASDHRGHRAKELLKQHLQSLGHTVEDFGSESTESCDYPDTAWPAARRVASGACQVGIMCCGTGIGMSMVANKVPGVRAALCHDELTAQLSRAHNNANVLCLPADLIGEELMRRVLDVWLNTEFEGGRHARRVQKIDQLPVCEEGSRKPAS